MCKDPHHCCPSVHEGLRAGLSAGVAKAEPCPLGFAEGKPGPFM